MSFRLLTDEELKKQLAIKEWIFERNIEWQLLTFNDT